MQKIKEFIKTHSLEISIIICGFLIGFLIMLGLLIGAAQIGKYINYLGQYISNAIMRQ